MSIVLREIKRVGGVYMLEGNSQRFKTIEDAKKHLRQKAKSKKKDGRRFWSEKLQMPFRSNWEIELAELLTDLGIKWEYEPQRFYFRGEGESYLPDIFLPEYNVWVEVKGWMDKRSLRRVKLFKKYYGSETGFFLYEKEERKICLENPEMIYTFIQIAIEERERLEKRL